MRFALFVLALALVASSAHAAAPKVQAVVGIWKVNMVTTTTAGTTSPATTTTSAPATTTTSASATTTTSAPATTTTSASATTTTSAPATTTTSAPATTTTSAPVPTPAVKSERELRHPRFPEVILHRHKRAAMDHENEFICSGTLVTAKFVLTTAECATAATSTMGTQVSAGLDVVKPDSKDVWIPMVKKTASGALAMLEVKQTVVTEVIPWSSTETVVGTKCTFTYWKQDADKSIKQVSQEVTTKACATGVKNSVCVAATPATRAICTGKSEGGALVCNKKVVGIYGMAADGSCNADVTAVKLYDVRQLNNWLKEVSGASTVAFSALLGVLAVAVTTLFN